MLCSLLQFVELSHQSPIHVRTHHAGQSTAHSVWLAGSSGTFTRPPTTSRLEPFNPHNMLCFCSHGLVWSVLRYVFSDSCRATLCCRIFFVDEGRRTRATRRINVLHVHPYLFLRARQCLSLSVCPSAPTNFPCPALRCPSRSLSFPNSLTRLA